MPADLTELVQKRMQPFDCEGFVHGRGPEGARLMFIGEAPGETEVIKGIPFIGRAGRIFDAFLKQMGKNREEIYITSTIRSRPYKFTLKTVKGVYVEKKSNRTPEKQELIAHAPILDYEINTIKPKILVPMGKTAFWRLTGQNCKMSDVAGTLLEQPIMRLENSNSHQFVCSKETYWIYPIYHPAALLYNPKLKPIMFDMINKLIQIDRTDNFPRSNGK